MEDPKPQEYDSEISAYKDVLDEFLEGVSLLRMNLDVHDQKLETYVNMNEKGVVIGYDYLGKIRFVEGTKIEEDDDLDTIVSDWKTIFKYALTKEEENNPKSKKPKKEKWVLERMGDERDEE
jgi:hypothetical protein